MSVTLVVLYTRPDDPHEFDRHYHDVHAPLVDRIPGLLSWDHSHFTGAADGGDLPWYQIANLRFADQESLEAGLDAPEGKAAGADYQKVAPAGSRMFIATDD
jgi:uncharacterized protein (TIGR02118 family)